jgi:hypothetical protein
MLLKRLVAATTLAALIATAAPATILAQQAGKSDQQYKHYANCTKLNKDYPHGVGKPGAVDHVSGHSKKVKNFYVSLGLYNANKGSDRDHDGIACEKL